MHILVSGVSHKTAPVEIREKLVFPEQEINKALEALLCYPDIDESVIISTCNRTEIYVVCRELDKGKDELIDFICSYHNLEKKNYKNIYIFMKVEMLSIICSQ